MITFIHTADWQIGKPFASIADPAKRARVQQERIEAIRRIGGVVRERRAAFVVVAGDLFDSPTPTNATVAAALGGIASLEVPVPWELIQDGTNNIALVPINPMAEMMYLEGLQLSSGGVRIFMVPEPMTMSLLALSALALLRKRRRYQ